MSPSGANAPANAGEAVPVASRYRDDPIDREAPPVTETDEVLRKAEQDVEAARQRDWLRATAQQIARIKDRLRDAGWDWRMSDDLFSHPAIGTRVDFGYAGGEFYVRVYRLPDLAESMATPAGSRGLPGSLTFRVTQAFTERNPLWATALQVVLAHIADGGDYWVHFDPSGVVPIGLEALGRSPTLFGDRTDAEPESESSRDPDPIDLDDGPPDMSGSTPGADR